MVLEVIPDILVKLTQLNTVLLLALFFVFIVLAYKIFQALIKAFIVGVISATFPVVANLMGMDVPLTISSVIWFAIFGVAAYLMYATISGGARIVGMAMKPFSRLFNRRPVQKVIIRERENKSK
jgi:hypothetical protein